MVWRSIFKRRALTRFWSAAQDCEMRAAERCNCDKRSGRRESAGGAVAGAASATSLAARRGARGVQCTPWPSGGAAKSEGSSTNTVMMAEGAGAEPLGFA